MGRITGLKVLLGREVSSVSKKILFLLSFLMASASFAVIIDFGRSVPMNPDIGTTTGSPSLAAITLDAAEEKIAFIVRPIGTQTLRKVGFVTGTVITGNTIDVRIESVEPLGVSPYVRPTGNLYCTNSSATVTINSVDDSKYKETDNLVSDCDVSNSTIAVVFARRGSFNGIINYYSLSRYDNTVVMSSTSASGYAVISGSPNMELYSDSGAIIDIKQTVCISTVSASSISVASNPNTIGNKITFPYAHTIDGVYAQIAASQDVDIKLIDSDGGTVLETIEISTSLYRSGVKTFFALSTTYTFDANESYRIVIQAKKSTTLNVHRIFYENSTLKNNQVVFGAYIDSTIAQNPVNEGSWTQNSLGVALIYPSILSIDTGASGGGTAIGVIGN